MGSFFNSLLLPFNLINITMEILTRHNSTPQTESQHINGDETKKKRSVPPVFKAQKLKKKQLRHCKHGSISALSKVISQATVFTKINFFTWKQTTDGYLYLERDDARSLFNLLDKTGIFDFHVTNVQKKIIYQHQVSKFLSNGWRLYANGYFARKGEVEIHHLDGNKQNNDPRNLRYVSPGLNYLCARAIKHEYTGEDIPDNVTESYEEAEDLVKLTFKRYLKRLGYSMNKSERDFLLSLDWNIARKILKSWQPPAQVTELIEKLVQE
jgi:hypothetical protein